MKRVFISDCEGPISKNDNAFELAANFVPNGDKLFTNISKYDDVLVDVTRRTGYTAGSTLKLILPFFKAYGITDRQMEEFSAQNIVLIANSQTTLRHVQTIADSYIVSTSYEHYIKAFCKIVDFPYKNTYCTKVNLDKCPITPKEKDALKEVAQEITQMPAIEIPPEAKGIKDFSKIDKELIGRLDQIFWQEIPKMFVGKFLVDVVTMGGEKKAESIHHVSRHLGRDLSDVMYVGDSITDVEAFQLVRANGGLAVSFNGNSYAVKSAEVVVLSESNLITAVIADLFSKLGKQKTINAIKNWTLERLKNSEVDPALLKQFLSLYPQVLPKAELVTTQNMETLIEESCGFRKKVRGVAIGKLG